MPEQLIEKIKREIEQFAPQAQVERVGRVVSAGDGVAVIEGLTDAVMAEMLLFDVAADLPLKESLKEKEPLYGLVLNLEEDAVKAVILGEASAVAEGMTVKSLGRVLSIPVGESLVGRVINPLGLPLDGRGPVKGEEQYPIERESYGVIDRQSVNAPIHTGTKAVDAMIPIGRGQRELIIGDRATGKTTIAIDAILNQKNEPAESRPTCIYVAVGQKEAKTARIVAKLRAEGAMEYTIVVTASSSAPAALQFLAPYAGAALGEYFMEKGKDALVVYDDLSKQAVAYRQLSLLLRRPPGREAYPGDIFYLHSRLLERAAKLSNAHGGGSLTALPIIETQENDVSAYIPTNVISITDGQIYLEADLFNKGVRPAMNVGISVSRVGSAAQTKAMKKVAGKLRLELAQFRELEAFLQFAQDLDPDTKARIERGARLTEILKQDKGKPLPFERQVPLLYAAVNNHFAPFPISRIGEVAEKFLTYVEAQANDIYDAIRASRDLSGGVEERLKKVIESFKTAHQELVR